jgi:hypothetical protein
VKQHDELAGGRTKREAWLGVNALQARVGFVLPPDEVVKEADRLKKKPPPPLAFPRQHNKGPTAMAGGKKVTQCGKMVKLTATDCDVKSVSKAAIRGHVWTYRE